MVDDDERAKIIDFGSSFVNDCTCAIGPHDEEKIWHFLTYRYASFEIWDEGVAATTKSDVWAFGCIMLEVTYLYRKIERLHTSADALFWY